MSVVRVEIILYLCMVYTAHHSNDLLFGRRALSGLERNLFPGFGRFRLKKQNPNVQNPRKKPRRTCIVQCYAKLVCRAVTIGSILSENCTENHKTNPSIHLHGIIRALYPSIILENHWDIPVIF